MKNLNNKNITSLNAFKRNSETKDKELCEINYPVQIRQQIKERRKARKT